MKSDHILCRKSLYTYIFLLNVDKLCTYPLDTTTGWLGINSTWNYSQFDKFIHVHFIVHCIWLTIFIHVLRLLSKFCAIMMISFTKIIFMFQRPTIITFQVYLQNMMYKLWIFSLGSYTGLGKKLFHKQLLCPNLKILIYCVDYIYDFIFAICSVPSHCNDFLWLWISRTCIPDKLPVKTPHTWMICGPFYLIYPYH
jgi:hypothetical protein